MLLKVLTGSILLAIHVCALAASPDECAYILKDGTMAKTSYKSNDYLRLVLQSRFSKQTYDQAKNDTSFGAVIPIEGIMVGVEGEDKSFEEHKTAIRRSLDMSRIENHQLEIAVYSGDPVIAAAWVKCMDEKQGLYVWFTLDNAKTAKLNVRWNGGKQYTPPSVRISAVDSEPKRAWTRNANSCLYPGRVYKHTQSCSQILTLGSATQDLSVTVQGESSIDANATAYLAPRVIWVDRMIILDSGVEVMPTSQYATASGQAGQNEVPGSTACFSQQKLGKAIPIKATFKPDTKYPYCYGAGHCSVRTSITDTQACWQAFAHPVGAACGCNIYGTMQALLAGWFPVDSPEVKTSPGLPRTATAIADRYRAFSRVFEAR